MPYVISEPGVDFMDKSCIDEGGPLLASSCSGSMTSRATTMPSERFCAVLVTVCNVLSTDEAVQALDRGRFGAVVTDMDRGTRDDGLRRSQDQPR
jgi:hypothetical protein